ncbi:DUF3054 domain-containing protein [Antribacter gilvus]|uniref:DUF3054 domain-containing protein n=1 Tax=Antribacter gilvus TaxID=2304675 RepID=UPI000F7B82FC|nr:DUF3054 domain-containing protein [Antribacter gilvus]
MKSSPVWPAVVADTVSVAAFALIGIASHDGSLAEAFVRVVWPFAVGAAVGWAWTRAWRSPDRLWPVGVLVWCTTVALGLALRALAGDGVAWAFAGVTAVFLAITMIGWRALVTGLRRAAERSAGTS